MEISLRITPQDIRIFFRSLLLLELAFVVLYGMTLYWDVPITVSQLLSLDGAASVSSWFSAIQLFCVGLLALIQARWSRPNRLLTRRFLLGVGCIFLFLSIDEALEVHERITLVLQQFAWVPRFRGNHGIWIPLYGAIGAGVMLRIQKRLRKLARAYPAASAYIFGGVAMFLAGAVGLEVVSYQLNLREMPNGWLYSLQVMLEEGMEMAGMTSLFYGAVRVFLVEMISHKPFSRGARV